MDGSGLRYQRNRFYDPLTRQFTQQDPIGLAGGINLYALAGGDPVNFRDPFGLCPMCVGAAVNVLSGWAIASLTGQEYTLADAAVDAAVGAIGVGIAQKLGRLSRVANAAEDGLGIIYRRTNQKTGEVYIDRSKDEAAFLRRQAAHDRTYGVQHQYEVIDRAEGGHLLRVREESAIRLHGGAREAC